jgi:protocatechuate 3,4-dioxygenase beta subunit
VSKLILLLAFFLNPQDKPPEKCAISGVAVDALTGRPLNKVEVSVDIHGEKYSEGTAFAVTDAQGHFSLKSLDPGRYFLAGSRNGYLTTYYGERRPGGGKIAIALEQPGQELKDVTVKLFPFAVIAGMVHDPDGEPLSGVFVTTWAVQFDADGKRFRQAGGDILSDDLGQFRIPNLEPGKYYVRAETEMRGATIDSFYPGVQDPELATMVEIAVGSRVTNLDIAVPRPPLFRVTVRVAAPAGSRPHCWLTSSRDEFSAENDYDSVVRGFNAKTGPHGEFLFEHVPAGSYTVHANAWQPEKCPKGMLCLGGGTGHYFASSRLDVNGDVEDFRINLTAATAVNAHFTVEAEDARPELEGHLVLRGGGETLFGEDRRASDLFSPGHYVVEFTPIPPGLYLKGVRSGSVDVLRDGLTLEGGGAVPLELALSDEVATLDGTVLDGDDQPVAGATVLLFPEPALRVRPDRYYTAIADQYGRYHLKDLAPGNYQVLAWDDVKPNSWFDPEFLKPLESAADSVAVRPKGHDTLKLHVRTAK